MNKHLKDEYIIFKAYFDSTKQLVYPNKIKHHVLFADCSEIYNKLRQQRDFKNLRYIIPLSKLKRYC